MAGRDDEPRYRLDDLRRLGVTLGASLGMPPARAAALVGGLLWYDSTGLPGEGISRLPGWLARVERSEVDPAAEGQIGGEHPATAILDARGGLFPLAVGRAASLAAEKARDAGVGLVRVRGLGSGNGPTAAIVADVAIGPYAGAVIGPGDRWSLAVPAPGGLPVIYDAALRHAGKPHSAADSLRTVIPMAGLLAPLGEVLVLAVAVAALEPLATFHEQVAAAMAGLGDAPGLIRPNLAEERREEARTRGIPLDAVTLRELTARADAAGTEPPRAVGRRK